MSAHETTKNRNGFAVFLVFRRAYGPDKEDWMCEWTSRARYEWLCENDHIPSDHEVLGSGYTRDEAIDLCRLANYGRMEE